MLIWAGIVVYLVIGMFAMLLTFNKTILRFDNPEGSLFKLFYLAGKGAQGKDPVWFADWVSMVMVVFTVITWPIVIPMALIILAIKKQQRSKK
jgi:hypothetical protein